MPPLGGGAWSSGSGLSPDPSRPIHEAGATRPAWEEAPERQVAGCGALGGTHRLQHGLIGAHKKACLGKVGRALTTRDPDRPRRVQAHPEHGASRVVLGMPSDPTVSGQSRAP